MDFISAPGNTITCSVFPISYTMMIMMTMFGGDGFCGDTNRCICSFNFAFTSDHPLVAHDEAADDYHANAAAHSQAHAHAHANKDKFA